MVIDALVQRVNEDNAGDIPFGEGFYKEVFELRNEGGMGYGGVFLDNLDDVISEMGEVACELVCEGWENFL